MKRFITLIVLILINIRICSATPQIPDLLVIGKDTFYLVSFPLKDLNLNKAPFNYGGFSFPHTGCWRGYQATWEIKENKLFLVQIIKVDSTKEKLDIVKYLKENNYSPTVIDGLILADWYSACFRKFVWWDPIYQNYLEASQKVLNPKLEIKKGLVVKNRLTHFDK